MKNIPLAAGLAGILALPLHAAELKVEFEIPRLNVAEYHRPYVAVWIEGADAAAGAPPFAPLAVLYDAKKKNNEGNQWLKDLRQWWRRGGRALDMPVDGIAGATPAVGRQRLRFTAGNAALGKLAAGDYKLVVEAVREVGGRELIALPFAWPPKEARRSETQGRHELGAVTLDLLP